MNNIKEGEIDMKKIKIYIAGRTSFVKKHNNLKNFLCNNLDCEVYLPHELVSPDTPKEKLPEEAFTKCVEHMDKADVILADMNIYGKDTSWELGYCFGNNKNVIGYTNNDSYKADFMVKGPLTHIATNQDEILDKIKTIFQE